MQNENKTRLDDQGLIAYNVAIVLNHFIPLI